MSVTKAGSDDGNCGLTNNDILHQAICRVVAGGITVVAAAANDSGSAVEARPGRLQRGHHGLGPRRHGRQARRPRRQPLLLVGRLRQGRHVRRLQQLRRRRRPHRARQVHLVDQARATRTRYSSGTRWPRPPSPAPSRSTRRRRPNATPAEVREALQYLGNLRLEDLDRPGLRTTSSCSTCRSIGPLGTFDLDDVGARLQRTARPAARRRSRSRSTGAATFFERVPLLGHVAARPAGPPRSATPACWAGPPNATTLSVTVPSASRPARTTSRSWATSQGRTETTTVTGRGRQRQADRRRPDRRPGRARRSRSTVRHADSLALRVAWPAATDPTSAVGALPGRVQRRRRRAGRGDRPRRRPAASLRAPAALAATPPIPGPRPATPRQLGAWAESTDTVRQTVVDDRSSTLTLRGHVDARPRSSSALRTTLRRPASEGRDASSHVHRPRRRRWSCRAARSRGKAPRSGSTACSSRPSIPARQGHAGAPGRLAHDLVHERIAHGRSSGHGTRGSPDVVRSTGSSS